MSLKEVVVASAKRILLVAVVIGVMATLLTGQISTEWQILPGTPAHYGYPLDWLVQTATVTPAGLRETAELKPLNLLLDVTFWTVVMALLILAQLLVLSRRKLDQPAAPPKHVGLQDVI